MVTPTKQVFVVFGLVANYWLLLGITDWELVARWASPPLYPSNINIGCHTMLIYIQCSQTPCID